MSVLTAAFSTRLVVSALVGIPVGRWSDRLGPRRIMTTGSVLAVPPVVGIALAPSLPVFFAAWVLAGVAMAGTLYAPAFAALTRCWGPRRGDRVDRGDTAGRAGRHRLRPLTAGLLGPLGWRDTYLTLAVRPR